MKQQPKRYRVRGQHDESFIERQVNGGYEKVYTDGHRVEMIGCSDKWVDGFCLTGDWIKIKRTP